MVLSKIVSADQICVSCVACTNQFSSLDTYGSRGCLRMDVNLIMMAFVSQESDAGCWAHYSLSLLTLWLSLLRKI